MPATTRSRKATHNKATTTTTARGRQQPKATTSNSVSDDQSASKKSDRIELFFTSQDQLKERLQLLQSHGYIKFNLVNKNAQDSLLDWSRAIHSSCHGDDVNVCAHFSLKYNKVARQGPDAHLQLFQDLCQDAASDKDNDDKNCIQEILMVSGGHNLSKPRPKWNTVDALQRLATKKADETNMPTIAVAYNPYFADPAKQEDEIQRLQAKLETGLVSKVYLQFGTDLMRLKQALKFLRESYPNVHLAGSLFLPTKQLIAQQKFRPWNGVFLSDEFLQGPESATSIVVELMKLYSAYNVEILWEAPGVRTAKDLTLIQQLTDLRDQDRDGDLKESKDHTAEGNNEPTAESTSSSGSSSPSPKRQKTNGNTKTSSAGVHKQHQAPNTERAESPPVLATDNAIPTNDFQLDKNVAILLFGVHDMRLYDNLAVLEACRHHPTILPVFLWTPLAITSGGIRAEALEVLAKEALVNLRDDLQKFDLPLLCRDCPTPHDIQTSLSNIIQETKASAIYYNRDYTFHGRQLENLRNTHIQQSSPGVETKRFQSVLLYDIDQVSLTKGFHGGHWGTLMPFYKNCQKTMGMPRRPIPHHETFGVLQNAKAPPTLPESHAMEKLPLSVLPANQRLWHQPIRNRYPNMSHEGAQDTLKRFFEASTKVGGFRRYESDRSRADYQLATSQLSAHLRLGTLSPNEVFYKAHDHPMDYYQKKTFARRLVWRDLAYYQLRCFPTMMARPIRSHYQDTEWVTGEEERRRFEAWKWGKTGYPIVDAGMRELYETGWMTQSVRMVVASFLVEYLRINWVKGCEWFHYTLVDADTAINAMMWQNAGKCGIDQWNFVLSPEAASQDPTGAYTRKWVPELSKLPTGFCHRPWQAPREVLQDAGVELGKSYPRRIVADLKNERVKSVESTLAMRRQHQECNDDKGYDTITLPNGDKTVVFTKKEYRIDRRGRVMKQNMQNNGSRTTSRKQHRQSQIKGKGKVTQR